MCDYEADDQITALANYYDCPVISADSDFYIYDLKKGFIMRDSVETFIAMDTDSDGNDYKFLNCYIYHIDDFVSCFPGIKKSVLPLFSTMIGNDYVEGHEFEKFFANVQLPKYRGDYLRVRAKQKKMIGLLCWLKNNTLNEAVNHVMQYLKKERRDYIKNVIEGAVRNYELRDCNLIHVIDQKLGSCVPESCFNSRLTTPCGNSLPLDFTLKYHNGLYSSFYVNVIVLHTVFLAPQVEDICYASSYACARNVRKILYGILIRHGVDGVTCQNEKCLSPIKEYDRQKSRLQKEMIEPVFELEGIGMLPKIDDLNNLDKDKCVSIIMESLDFNINFIISMPDEWQLLTACINYWLKNCEPFTTEAFLYALIINLIYFSVINPKYHSEHLSGCCTKTSSETADICSCAICILSKISDLERQNATKNLKKYLTKPTINNGNPLLLYILHSYSQLQSCIVSATSLNKLLGDFMKNPEPHKCFTGTLLYNLTKDIASRSNRSLFVAEMLGRETNLYGLFTVLDSVMRRGIPSHCILKNGQYNQKSRKKSARHFSAHKTNTNVGLTSFGVLNNVETL